MAKSHYDVLGVVPRVRYDNIGRDCYNAAVEEAERKARGRTDDDRRFDAQKKLTAIIDRNQKDPAYQEAFATLSNPVEAMNYFHAQQEAAIVRERNMRAGVLGGLGTAVGAGMLAATLTFQQNKDTSREVFKRGEEDNNPKNTRTVENQPQRKVFRDIPADIREIKPRQHEVLRPVPEPATETTQASIPAAAPVAKLPESHPPAAASQPEPVAAQAEPPRQEQAAPRKGPRARIIGIDYEAMKKDEAAKLKETTPKAPHGRIIGIDREDMQRHQAEPTPRKPHGRILGIEPSRASGAAPPAADWPLDNPEKDTAPKARESRPPSNGGWKAVRPRSEEKENPDPDKPKPSGRTVIR